MCKSAVDNSVNSSVSDVIDFFSVPIDKANTLLAAATSNWASSVQNSKWSDKFN